ncbi:MAG: antibiotic biosynthesis monooxygenase [Alphaproteobacteria bacterium]|nr:antibiotic biosynthesis monooxygenase [Alphaproteobacteria bacterium]
MIARTWRARATAAKAPAYVKHFTEAVAPHLKELAGHKGAWLLQREAGGGVEFVAITLWESRKVIEAFAGENIGRSHVEPEGQAALESFDHFADHYEVAYGG